MQGQSFMQARNVQTQKNQNLKKENEKQFQYRRKTQQNLMMNMQTYLLNQNQ